MKKAAVVGGGVSGLIVGARLAQAGFGVQVFESAKQLGGRAVGQTRDGFSLDYGLHIIRNGVKGLLPTTMERLGAPMPLCVGGHPEFSYFKDGCLLPFPQDREALMASDIISMDEKVKCLMMLRPGIYDEFKGVSVGKWLESIKASAALEDFMRVLSSCVVCPFPDLVSAGEVFDYVRRRILLGAQPFALPEGGYFKALGTLADYIQGRGGAIHTESAVRRIVIEQGRAAGVETDSGPHHADIVVASFPYKHLFDILDPETVAAEKREMLISMTPTAGVCIDFALDAPATEAKNIIVTYGDPFIYGMAVSNLDPSLAPPGKQLITFTQIARIEDMVDPQKSDEIADNLEDTAFEIFPEMEGKLLWMRELKLEMINSVQVNFAQHRDARPEARCTGVPGLYLAGDALSAPGGGGDLAVESANLCADAVIQDHSGA